MHTKKCDDAIKTAETKEWQAAHLFMCVHYIMQVKWTNCLFAHNILFRRERRRRRRRRLKKRNSMKILYTSCVYYVDLQIYEKWFDFLVERSTIKNLSGEKCVESPHTHPSIHTEGVSFVVEKHNDLNRNVISSCLFIHVSLWFEYFYYSHEKNDK